MDFLVHFLEPVRRSSSFENLDEKIVRSIATIFSHRTAENWYDGVVHVSFDASEYFVEFRKPGDLRRDTVLQRT